MNKKYKLRLKKPCIRYPSSLIQQNYGESLVGHGASLWNVNDRSYEHVEIKNDYGYCTLEINNGKIDSYPDIPIRARLRLKFRNTTEDKIKKIVSDIKTKYPRLVELTVMRSNDFDSSGTSINQSVIGDVHNIGYQNSLIETYLMEKHSLDPDIISDILELNSEMNKELPSRDFHGDTIWKPGRFEFSNMFSYGRSNVVDFSNMSGVYGIFAPNASGKSSLLDSLSFCLFDKSSRAYKASNIMNNKKNSFNCSVDLSINNRMFGIKKKSKRTKISTPVSIEFSELVDGKMISYNGDQRSSTNQNIREYIGTFDDFVMTTWKTQKQDSNFIDMSQRERKELLANFLSLSVFDDLYQIANEHAKEVSSILKDLSKRNLESELSRYESDIQKKKEDFQEVDTEKNNIEKELETVRSSVMSLHGKLIHVDESIIDIDFLKNKRIQLEEQQRKISNSIEDSRNKISALADNIKRAESEISGDFSDVQQNYEKYISELDLYNQQKNKIERMKIEYSSNKDKLGKLSKLQFNENCDSCLGNMNIFTADEMKIKADLEKFKQIATDNLKELKSLETRVNEKKHYEDQYNTYNSKMRELNLLRSKIVSEKSIFDSDRDKFRIVEDQIQETQKNIHSYHKNKEVIENNKIVQKNIDEKQLVLNSLQEDLKRKLSHLQNLHGQILVSETKKEEVLGTMKRVRNLEAEEVCYRYYIEAIKRNGIPYELISKVMPVFESEINNILSHQDVDFRVIVNVDGKNIDAYIAYDEDNHWPIELLSGFEKFTVSTAILVSLRKISNLPKSNFLIIDEGFSAMDSDNLNNLYMLFNYLRTQFEFVLIISHLDSMKDMVDNYIEIKKVNGYSKVQFE